MTLWTDSDLYVRGVETFLAAWEADADGSPGAAVTRFPGVVPGVFPDGPERAFLNNALLERDLEPAERSDALEQMEAAYATAGIDRFAAWVHESDGPMRRALETRGYTLDTSTRAMGMALDDIRVPPPDIDVRAADWSVYLAFVDALAPGLMAGVDPTAYRVVAAREDGETVAAGLSSTPATTAASTTSGPSSTRAGAGSAPRSPRGSCTTPRTRMPHRDPPVHADGRARLRGRGLSRPRALPRVRAGTAGRGCHGRISGSLKRDGLPALPARTRRGQAPMATGSPRRSKRSGRSGKPVIAAMRSPASAKTMIP